MIKLFVCIELFGLLCSSVYGQELSISLEKVMNEWCLASPAAEKIKLSYENELLEFANYQKEFLPSIAFTLSPVNFNRSQRLMQHPEDGSYSYVEDYSNNSAAGLAVRQKVGIIGGELTVNSNFNFLREFSSNRNRFGTNPLSLNYSQSIFGGHYNYKKKKRIEYAKHNNSLKHYCSDIADVQAQAVNLFLDLFLMNLSVELAVKNLHVSDTLLLAGKALFENGHFTEYEYHQIELQNMNDKYACESSLKNYKKSLRNLFSFLGKSDWKDEDFEIVAPKFTLPLDIDYALVSFYAYMNSPFALSQERSRLEAEQVLFNAKLNNRFNGSLNINYGLNQYAERFVEAYRNPDYSQGIMIGLQIPIFQWGINRNRLRIAKNNYRNVMIDLDKSKNDFDNGLKEEIDEYNHNMNLWLIAERAYRLSEEQYRVLARKFIFGKVSVYDIASVQQEQNEAMRRYYTSVQDVWNSFCSLRRTTLYDFIQQRELKDILLP